MGGSMGVWTPYLVALAIVVLDHAIHKSPLKDDNLFELVARAAKTVLEIVNDFLKKNETLK